VKNAYLKECFSSKLLFSKSKIESSPFICSPFQTYYANDFHDFWRTNTHYSGDVSAGLLLDSHGDIAWFRCFVRHGHYFGHCALFLHGFGRFKSCLVQSQREDFECSKLKGELHTKLRCVKLVPVFLLMSYDEENF
jgi:hypothetical protein